MVPVGWSYNAQHDTIDVTGRDLDQTKKFRDVVRNGRAAIVIDDLASTELEIRPAFGDRNWNPHAHDPEDEHDRDPDTVRLPRR